MYTMSAIVNSFMLPLIVNNHSTEQQFPNQTLSTALVFTFCYFFPSRGAKYCLSMSVPCHISTKCSNFCACLLTLWCSPPMMIMQYVTYFSNINQAKTIQLNWTHPPHDSREEGLAPFLQILKCQYTHTHPSFNGPFSGTTRVGRYQKGKNNLDFTEARDSEWQGHQLGHMQVCTSLQTDNHASTSPLSFYRPDALPASQPTASKHWRQISNASI